MNSYVFGFVAVAAVLTQSISAQCICNNIVASPILLPAPILSGPIFSAPLIPAPIVSAPILPTTTIVQTNCNSVTESLVDVLQMLPVASLLANKLPLGPNIVAAPIISPPILSPCGCGCGPTIYF